MRARPDTTNAPCDAPSEDVARAPIGPGESVSVATQAAGASTESHSASDAGRSHSLALRGGASHACTSWPGEAHADDAPAGASRAAASHACPSRPGGAHADDAPAGVSRAAASRSGASLSARLQLSPGSPKKPAGPLGTWTHAALLTLQSGWMALFCLGAAFVLPFEGFGPDICGVHRLTGCPCPGCGLTRAFISIAHGEVRLALGANPFVLVLFPAFVFLAAWVLMPFGMRATVERFLARHGTFVGSAYKILVFSFLGFGALRFGYFFLAGGGYP